MNIMRDGDNEAMIVEIPQHIAYFHPEKQTRSSLGKSRRKKLRRSFTSF